MNLIFYKKNKAIKISITKHPEHFILFDTMIKLVNLQLNKRQFRFHLIFLKNNNNNLDFKSLLRKYWICMFSWFLI